MSKLSTSALAAIFVLTAASCHRLAVISDELAAAEQGSDSAQVTSDEAAVLTVTVDGTENARLVDPQAPPTPAAVATTAAANARNDLIPTTCFTATVADDTVTYSFNDCTGPRGLVHLNGVIDVVYSTDDAGIHAHATTTDFAVNNSTLSFDDMATYTVVNGDKSLAVQLSGDATGPLGNHFTRAGSYTVTWTSTCETLDGEWSVTAAVGTRSTTVTDFNVCKGACPGAGGTISHTYRTGLVINITFDGTAVAHWMIGSVTGIIDLVCRPA